MVQKQITRIALDAAAPDFAKAYETLSLFQSGPPVHGLPVHERGVRTAVFGLDSDLAPLFPYINAVIPDAKMYAKPVYIKFVWEGRLIAFYPHEGRFAPVLDLSDALAFLPRLARFLTDIHDRRSEIVADYKQFKTTSPLDVLRLLPGSNCKACGYATCMAFAAVVSRQMVAPDRCPHLIRPVEEQATFPLLDEKGRCVRTLSLTIDSGALRERIRRTEARIAELQTRLRQYEQLQAMRIDQANQTLPAPLTRREVEVLQQLAAGATNKSIAAALHISDHTVKSHVVHIFNKIGVNDRTQASVWAAAHGLL